MEYSFFANLNQDGAQKCFCDQMCRVMSMFSTVLGNTIYIFFFFPEPV